MTSAVSEKQQRAMRQQAKADRAGAELTIRAIMSTIHGRRWTWLQLAACGCFHDNNHNDPAAFGRQEGLRQAGLRLLGQVQRYTPREYMMMTQENTGVELEQDDNDDHHDAG
jgi:hypothetical protein